MENMTDSDCLVFKFFYIVLIAAVAAAGFWSWNNDLFGLLGFSVGVIIFLILIGVVIAIPWKTSQLISRIPKIRRISSFLMTVGVAFVLLMALIYFIDQQLLCLPIIITPLLFGTLSLLTYSGGKK